MNGHPALSCSPVVNPRILLCGQKSFQQKSTGMIDGDTIEDTYSELSKVKVDYFTFKVNF